MTFSKPWSSFPTLQESDKLLPVLAVYLRTGDGRWLREQFVVDSEADISMGPRSLCEWLGLRWETGTPVEVRGIAAREECKVPAMIHSVDIQIREAACQFTIPFCFAEGDAPPLLGREGLFDAFRITFDKGRFLTEFDLHERLLA
jgi:hypothetical protein